MNAFLVANYILIYYGLELSHQFSLHICIQIDFIMLVKSQIAINRWSRVGQWLGLFTTRQC